jgi:membrane fusion protein, heavy metal efflux system
MGDGGHRVDESSEADREEPMEPGAYGTSTRELQRAPLRARPWRMALVIVLLAVALVAAGVAGGILAERHGWRAGLARVLPGSWLDRIATPTPAPSTRSAAPGKPENNAAVAPSTGPISAGPAVPSAPVEVILTPEAMSRVGIKTAKVTAVEATTAIQVPGTVMANAYREVKVTPIAAGVVTRVHVELGAAVKRGDPLAILFSTDLADAQTKYLSMSAMLEADHRKLERTRQLVAIGAASRQELEEVTAVHESHATEVVAARQRLLQLGLRPEQVEGLRDPGQVVSTLVVPAPIDGVITGRAVNLGQVATMGQELMVVTDLAEVWSVGEVYEQDFAAVGVGSEAAITMLAYPGLTLRGRVSYIDPRVDPQARTAKVRVELPNPEGRLRLGMYVTMAFRTRGGEAAVVVPRAAVQTLGDRQVVFLPARDEEGKFTQREVRLGAPVDGGYTVLSGLRPGDLVVTDGSFFLRSESLRNAPGG